MMEEVRLWLPAIAALISVASVIYFILTSPAKTAAAAAEAVTGRVDQLEQRLVRIESELPHLPDRESVHRLELSVSDMRGDMRAMAERMTTVSETSRRLQEWLLEQGK
jgi:hypothetical protein